VGAVAGTNRGGKDSSIKAIVPAAEVLNVFYFLFQELFRHWRVKQKPFLGRWPSVTCG